MHKRVKMRRTVAIERPTSGTEKYTQGGEYRVSEETYAKIKSHCTVIDEPVKAPPPTEASQKSKPKKAKSRRS
jgi:hypothetical protein